MDHSSTGTGNDCDLSFMILELNFIIAMKNKKKRTTTDLVPKETTCQNKQQKTPSIAEMKKIIKKKRNPDLEVQQQQQYHGKHAQDQTDLELLMKGISDISKRLAMTPPNNDNDQARTEIIERIPQHAISCVTAHSRMKKRMESKEKLSQLAKTQLNDAERNFMINSLNKANEIILAQMSAPKQRTSDLHQHEIPEEENTLTSFSP